MLKYLQSETERLEKEIKVANYEMEETAKNGISTELIGRIGKVTELTKELSTLIKTSWIFARGEGEWFEECMDIDTLEGEEPEVRMKMKSKELQEIISYCEQKAKEHKVNLEGKC